MKKSLVAMAVFAVFVFMFSFGCKKAPPTGAGGSGTSTYTSTPTSTSTYTLVPTSTTVTSPNLSGTITFPAGAIGKPYAIMVDSDTNTANGVDYYLIGTVSSTSMPYGFSVPVGAYYVWAFVDMNNSGMSGPGGMDYTGNYNTWTQVLAPAASIDFSCTTRLDMLVTLNVTIPAAAAGKKGFFGLFSTKDYATIMGGGPVVGADWVIPSGTSFKVTFTVSAADAGNYYLLGFADATSQCPSSGGCLPATGDYVGIYGGNQNVWPAAPNLAVNGDLTISLPLSTAVDNVSGTISLPAAITGKAYTVFISPDKLGGGGGTQPVTKTAVATGSSINYSLYVFVPGSYYIIAAIDNDGSGWDNGGNGPVNDGDYVGVYGVTPPIINWSNPFPALPNAVMPGTGLNITAQLFYQSGVPPTPTPVPTPSSAGGTGTISGIVTFPAAQAGKTLSIDVDMDLIPGNGNELSSIQVPSIAGTTQAYTISGLPVGTYYVYGAATAGGGGGPQIGDAVGVYGTTWPVFPGGPNASVTNGGTKTADITMITGSANVSGRVTMPSAADGKSYVIMIDTDMDGGNGAMAMATGTISGSNTYFDYSAFLPLPGDYYIYGIVDTAAPYGGAPNCGDFVGIYPVNYPLAVHLTPGGANTNINFSADMGAMLCP